MREFALHSDAPHFLRQCKKIKKANEKKKKKGKKIYIYPYYKSLKNSSFLFTSRVVKKITPAVLVLK